MNGAATLPAEHGTRARQVRNPLLVAGGIAIATGVLALVNPVGRLPACPFHAVTGWYCPVCGGLRATHDLARLDLGAAWAMNPLWVISIPLLVALWATWLWRAWRGRSLALPTWVLWAGAAVLVAFTVARNIGPLAPALAPAK